MSTDLTTYENLLAAITVDDGTAVHDPATGEFIGNTRVSTPADVDAAVARASQAQVSWGALTHAERSAYLHKAAEDRKSTRLNSSHVAISYAVFCLKKKTE